MSKCSAKVMAASDYKGSRSAAGIALQLHHATHREQLMLCSYLIVRRTKTPCRERDALDNETVGKIRLQVPLR